jgi:hypothetical protein
MSDVDNEIGKETSEETLPPKKKRGRPFGAKTVNHHKEYKRKPGDSPYMQRKRDGGNPTPEGSRRCAERNREFNKTGAQSKTTFCLTQMRGIKGTRCLQDGCFYESECSLRPPENIPKWQQICPVPEHFYEQQLQFYKELPVMRPEFVGSAELAA